jgi:hypothetical protein
MINDDDADLVRWFAEPEKPRADDWFLEQIVTGLRRARRVRFWRRAAVVTVLVFAAAMITPFVISASLMLARLAAKLAMTLGRALPEPFGLSGAMLLAWLVLRRRYSPRR